MGAVWFRAWAGLRARARVASLLTVLLAVAFAAVLAAAAGSARGSDALDRFVVASRPSTIEAFVNPVLPLDEQDDLVAELAGVVEAWPHAALAATVVALPGPQGVEGAGTDVIVALAQIVGGHLTEVAVPIVVGGELPLEPGQAAVNEALARRRGLEVGDSFEVAAFLSAELERLGNGELTEPAATQSLVVGAVVRHPWDLARSPSAQAGTLFEADDARLFLHPSFWTAHGPDLAGYGRGVVARPPPERAAALVAELRAVAGDRAVVVPGRPEELARLEPVHRAIALETNALLALAAVVAVVSLGLVGGTARRGMAEDPLEHVALVALGYERRQLAAVEAVRAGLVGGAAALLAVGLAVAVSPWFPLGLAGAAEVQPGIDVDAGILVGGALLLSVALVVRVVLGAAANRPRWTPRPSPGPSALRWLPALPAVGARLALAGARGRAGGAVRAGMAAAVAGVGAVAAAGTFGASLAHLVDSPEHQGWAWDVVVGNFSQPGSSEAGRVRLEENPEVAGHAGYTSLPALLDGSPTWLLALDPGGERVAPVVLDGRAPETPDEVALGRGTLEALGKDIGDEVEVGAGVGAARLRIVGEVVAPAVLVPEMDLDTGGTITLGGAVALRGGDPTVVVVTSYAVRLAVPEEERPAAVDRLRVDFPGTVLGPMPATDVRNLDRVRSFPYVLAVLLGLLAVGSVVIVLATLARRRRRDVAVIRALGAEGRHVRLLLGAQATALIVLALLVGLPLGNALGRVLWRLTAASIGSAVGPSVPLAGITVVALVVLAVVNVAAQVTAASVLRARPGPDLRVE